MLVASWTILLVSEIQAYVFPKEGRMQLACTFTSHLIRVLLKTISSFGFASRLPA